MVLSSTSCPLGGGAGGMRVSVEPAPSSPHGAPHRANPRHRSFCGTRAPVLTPSGSPLPPPLPAQLLSTGPRPLEGHVGLLTVLPGCPHFQTHSLALPPPHTHCTAATGWIVGFSSLRGNITKCLLYLCLCCSFDWKAPPSLLDKRLASLGDTAQIRDTQWNLTQLLNRVSFFLLA